MSRNPPSFAEGLIKVVVILLVMTSLLLCLSALASCSALHPSDRTPDAEWFDGKGHKYYGFRAGNRGSIAHAGDCPHASHIKMHPDTVYVNRTTERPNR